jgi:hypothetical protein
MTGEYAVDTEERQADIIAMEPAERTVQVVLKLAFIVLALIVSLVFDEFGHGIVGLVICVVGFIAGAIALKIWKTL